LSRSGWLAALILHTYYPFGNPIFITPNKSPGCDLTKKAEPRRIRDVDRDSGTAMTNRRWLRRLVRHQRREIHNKIGKSKRSHIRRLRTCSPQKPARAESKLTRRDFLISNRTAQIFASPTDQLKPQTDLDA